MNSKINNLKALAGISAIIGGVSISVVALVAIFSPQQLHIAAWIVAPLCLMGTALGCLSARAVS